jgi:hypothetical protein
MQIDIDFEVFKALTALRQSEVDSYNAVIRRLLGLQTEGQLNALLGNTPSAGLFGLTPNALASLPRGNVTEKGSGPVGGQNALGTETPVNELIARYLGGAWFNNVHFPEGTKFRATYKGQTHLAEISGGKWVGVDGISRNSPSDAASAITNTNVNGWRFWFAQMPGDPNWRRIDELRL